MASGDVLSAGLFSQSPALLKTICYQLYLSVCSMLFEVMQCFCDIQPATSSVNLSVFSLSMMEYYTCWWRRCGSSEAAFQALAYLNFKPTEHLIVCVVFIP